MEQGTLLFIASWKNAGVYPSRESRALLSSPLTTGKFCFVLTGRRVFFNSFDKHPSRDGAAQALCRTLLMERCVSPHSAARVEMGEPGLSGGTSHCVIPHERS